MGRLSTRPDQLIRAFGWEEVLHRSLRVASDKLRRGPIHPNTPDLTWAELRENFAGVAPALGNAELVKRLIQHALPGESRRDELVNQIHDGDLRFVGDDALRFDHDVFEWNTIPGFKPWPSAPSHTIAIRRLAAANGDVRRIWHLNKHTHWPLLARHFAQTGDEKDLELLVRQWQGWIESNPPGVGVNWASELEVGERVIHWIVTMLLLGDDPPIEDSVGALVANAFAAHGGFLFERLTTWSYNHSIGEATALLLLSNVVRSPLWYTKAAATLARKIDSLFLPDGTYREKSPSYSWLVYQYLTLAGLAMRSGAPAKLPDLIADRLEKLGASLDLMATEHGHLPNIGDNDDASILDYHFERRSLRDHICWSLPPDPGKAEPRTCELPGYGILIGVSGATRALLNVDNAPIRSNIAPHIHDDVLHTMVWHDGKPVIHDPGTYSYSADVVKRNWYRGAAAHNGPVLEGAPQSVPMGLFRWSSIQRGRTSGVRDDPTSALVSGARADGQIVRSVIIEDKRCFIVDHLLPRERRTRARTGFLFDSLPTADTDDGTVIEGPFGTAYVGWHVRGSNANVTYRWAPTPYSTRYNEEIEGKALRLDITGDGAVWCFFWIAFGDKQFADETREMSFRMEGPAQS